MALGQGVFGIGNRDWHFDIAQRMSVDLVDYLRGVRHAGFPEMYLPQGRLVQSSQAAMCIREGNTCHPSLDSGCQKQKSFSAGRNAGNTGTRQKTGAQYYVIYRQVTEDGLNSLGIVLAICIKVNDPRTGSCSPQPLHACFQGSTLPEIDCVYQYCRTSLAGLCSRMVARSIIHDQYPIAFGFHRLDHLTNTGFLAKCRNQHPAIAGCVGFRIQVKVVWIHGGKLEEKPFHSTFPFGYLVTSLSVQ